MPESLLNLISDGDTTTSASKKEINTRQHSKQNTASLNLMSCVTDPPVTFAHKVSPGLQDLQKRVRRILAERNAEKAEENTWIGWMVAAENINDMKVLIKSRDSV